MRMNMRGRNYGGSESGANLEKDCGGVGAGHWSLAAVTHHYYPVVLYTYLGHESSRTTGRYTHVTKRGFDKLFSPLYHISEGFNLGRE
jgi:hypothetical protein